MARKSKVNIKKRLQVVLTLIRREEAAHLIARRYGISEKSLYRWRDQFLEAGKPGMVVGNGK